MSLYITAAQANPPGKDVARFGQVQNDRLNEEWLEFQVLADRDLVGDVLTHRTFNDRCQLTAEETLAKFATLKAAAGQSVRVHTGRGSWVLIGSTHHIYLDHGWYVWNNRCGDRATLSYDNRVIDSAYYSPNPAEGILYRVQGTDRLEPRSYQRFA